MKKFIFMIAVFTIAVLLNLSPTPISAQDEIMCETDEIVQADDWLSKIAQKYYEDALAYQIIADATNAKAATDDSYATIENVDLIEPGWKLCIPSLEDAQALMETSMATSGSSMAKLEGDSVVHVTFLHMNDIYEITPVSGGAEGGLARVATVRKQLLADNPNTYTTLGGDLFSPSALGTAKFNDERLAGQQTVGVMNTLGLDFITFGNHEFDIKEEQFLNRLSESNFTWFSSNVFDANQQPFPDIADNHILTVTNENGAELKIGFFGVTLDSNPQDYVSYTDPFEASAAQMALLEEQTDFQIGLTHLAVTDDAKLAAQLPQIDLILGGHEHENMLVDPGPGLASIYKADANARTVYIIDLYYDTATDEFQIKTRLMPITDQIADDLETLQTVNEWLEKGFAGFKADGFTPEQIVAEVPIALDGLESSVRNGSTELTKLVAASMLTAAPGTELAIYNSGSIRIDDIIPPGNITEYDIIRVLPFGGEILGVAIKGDVLKQVLDQGQANKGKGGYLQTANVEADAAGNWLIKGEVLDSERVYTVSINDYLLLGFEEGLEFLTEDNEAVEKLETYTDIRKALIEQLKLEYGQ